MNPNQHIPPPNSPPHVNRVNNVPDPNDPPMRQFFVPCAYEPSLPISFEGLGNIDFEIKPRILSILPSFHGQSSEDLLEHVIEFVRICSTLSHLGVSQEVIKLKLFPFTLKEKAKGWFHTLASGSITSWSELLSRFYHRFYSMAKTIDLRTAIRTFSQFDNEPFHESWERFNDYIRQCPHHGYNQRELLQYFYTGLTAMQQVIVTSIAGVVSLH